MRTTPFELRACPPVRAAEARATRALGAVLASLPPAWRADLPPFGAASFTLDGVDAVAPPGQATAFTLLRGPARGRLALAEAFAARIVDAALGGRGSFSTARRLGPAERGLLAALLAPALDPIGWSPDVNTPPASGGGVAVAARVEGALGAGTLWLELPTPTAPESSPAWRARAAPLPIAARLQLARTALPSLSLAQLAPGDALVFDGTPSAAFGPDVDWRALLRVGAHAVPVRLDPDGGVAVTGDFQLTLTVDGRKVGSDKERSMDVSGPTQIATEALAAAPIEITAELGRLTLRGDEVLSLAPGVVLTMAAARPRAVVLRAGGELWAEGELVDVEGELGVRVTRLLRP